MEKSALYAGLIAGVYLKSNTSGVSEFSMRYVGVCMNKVTPYKEKGEIFFDKYYNGHIGGWLFSFFSKPALFSNMELGYFPWYARIRDSSSMNSGNLRFGMWMATISLGIGTNHTGQAK